MRYELSNGKDRVYQWDHDITITILEPENVPTVHFRWGGKAVPLTVTNQQVEIPPELMQLHHGIVIWAYTPDHTMDMARIPMEKRPKPSDYAYTPTEIKTWEQLDERIKSLEYGGSKYDPIPYSGNMALVAGKYYRQDGVTYHCTRDTGNPVYNALSELVGLYVERVD